MNLKRRRRAKVARDPHPEIANPGAGGAPGSFAAKLAAEGATPTAEQHRWDLGPIGYAPRSQKSFTLQKILLPSPLKAASHEPLTQLGLR